MTGIDNRGLHLRCSDTLKGQQSSENKHKEHNPSVLRPLVLGLPRIIIDSKSFLIPV